MLSLVVPGLIWPRQALADLAGDLPLPALTRLLGSGRLRRVSAADAAATVAAAAGVEPPRSGAALRRLAYGRPADDAHWLCIDPGRLRFEERSVVLDDPRLLDLREDEAAALAVALAPTFADLGTLDVLSPGQWNLRLAQPAPAFPALPGFIGRAAAPLPGGPDYAPWRRALNDAQMALHAHPVNRTREAAGKPVVNTLWPWGSGRLPGDARMRPTTLLADDPSLRGLAVWHGAAAGVLPDRLPEPLAGSTLALFDALDAPARLGDALAWRDALTRLEDAWLAPALAAMHDGRLKHLHLHAPGERGSAVLEVARRDLWRFWRKPRPLHECLAEAGTP